MLSFIVEHGNLIMRRKSQPKPDQAVPVDLFPEPLPAKVPLLSAQERKTDRCVVCGADTSSGLPEPLCWVCRRLKVSAWRDVEQQIPAQE